MIRKSLAICFLFSGILLLYTGYERAGSASEGVTCTLLTGPWLFVIAGAVLFVSGSGLLVGGKKR